jgi:hypothetical protein
MRLILTLGGVSLALNQFNSEYHVEKIIAFFREENIRK